jgi:DNA-binding YbaB/EbfC family protein
MPATLIFFILPDSQFCKLLQRLASSRIKIYLWALKCILMFGDLFSKLQEAQQKMQEGKQKLGSVTVEGEAGNGAVKVSITGNREVKTITIDNQLMAPDKKEELEDLLITALNRALQQAEQAWENEMKDVAGGMLGGLGQ